MNTANLQLEGLTMAVAAITRMLTEKGLATHQDIRSALKNAEEEAAASAGSELSGSNQKGILFPIRLLSLANDAAERGESASFKTFARQVGLSDRP
ncbi:hypothetical protein [Rhizobium sp. CC-YZS058]|uniref:hypothetical protein n=1 Tax=Rhizobium sp. CC-YZS058 TaxID=3042153 RepID=UPI002B0537C8|nr:hypothetical protein [Rhizobium sp. CC-YZS058]MEA3534330.1 hypothetical protein [Rhizobium sp. CC-YZS058]